MIANEVVQNFDDDEYDDKFVESYYIKDEYQRKLFNLFHSDYMYFFWKRIQTIYDNILNDEKTKVSENEYRYLKEKEVIDFFIPDNTIIENYVIFESDTDKSNTLFDIRYKLYDYCYIDKMC